MKGYKQAKTKQGVTVHSDKTGRNYHVGSQGAAKRLEKLHDAFSHMRANHTLFKK